MSVDANTNEEFSRLLKAFHAATERGDTGDMESLAADLISVAASEQDPSEDLLLRQKASDLASAGRWKEAESGH